MAETAIGTLWRFSELRCAVTTMSSTCGPLSLVDAACASTGKGVKALHKRNPRINRDASVLFSLGFAENWSSFIVPLRENLSNIWNASCVPSDTLFSPLETSSSGLSGRSEEHTSELQSLMRISYAVFCLKKKTQ